MATIVVSENDPRGPKAVALAAEPHRWHKVTVKATGQVVWAIPSQREDNHYWLTDGQRCTCPDFRWNTRVRRGAARRCKHVLACQLRDQAAAAAKYDAIFARFDDDRPLTRQAHPEVSRILGGPAPWTKQQRGVIPASQIVRED